MTMKQPNKQYETHTTIKLHGETIPMTILAGVLLDLANPSKYSKIKDWLSILSLLKCIFCCCLIEISQLSIHKQGQV